MKITICDPCKLEDGKISECTGRLKIKGLSMYNSDLCDHHIKELQKLTVEDYKKRVMKMHNVENLYVAPKNVKG